MNPGAAERGVPPGSRGVRLAGRPSISVVVAAVHGGAALDACLSALLPQCRAHGAELVVACGGDADVLEALRAAYPTARLVPAPPGTEPRRLRAIGAAAATGDVVALTDDRAPVSPDWLTSLAGPAGGAAPADRTAEDP